MQIELDFDGTKMKARLFDTAVAQRLYENLPVEAELVSWGDESYGSIGIDLGEEDPVPTIPAGGIAYTNRGEYLCLFYGQQPAWPVEHVGEIFDGEWEQLTALRPKWVRVTVVGE